MARLEAWFVFVGWSSLCTLCSMSALLRYRALQLASGAASLPLPTYLRHGQICLPMIVPICMTERYSYIRPPNITIALLLAPCETIAVYRRSIAVATVADTDVVKMYTTWPEQSKQGTEMQLVQRAAAGGRH